MLLTITYRGENTTEIGYLFHKNPDRHQVFLMNFGKAYVFYTKAEYNETTIALLLDINPIDLARGKLGSKDGGLFDYVNDRPYVSSSFMSTAISKTFSTAMSMRCDKKPDLVDKKLNLEANIYMLPCKGDKTLVERIFKPLGYEVSYQSFFLDEKFPQWGESQYVNVNLKGEVRLGDLLNHLYVLIPVFDNSKHYWISESEVEKLFRHGEGWLQSHPEKNVITYRYLNKNRKLINMAAERLKEEDDNEDEEDCVKESPQKQSLNTVRINTVVDTILSLGAASVIDLGCGEGKLISDLLKRQQITKVTGVDVSVSALERANERLKTETMPVHMKEKLQLIHGSVLYRDSRFCGYDVACIIEVIEHLDESRLASFEKVIFGYACPLAVILTTPNFEYNNKYENLNDGSFRHGDHRFEWTREQFRMFCDRICKNYGYTVEIRDIGDVDELCGSPTQMGVFKKCE